MDIYQEDKGFICTTENSILEKLKNRCLVCSIRWKNDKHLQNQMYWSYVKEHAIITSPYQENKNPWKIYLATVVSHQTDHTSSKAQFQ